MKKVSIAVWIRPVLVPFLAIAIYEIAIRLFLTFGGTSSKLIVLPLPTQILRRLAEIIAMREIIWAAGSTLGTTLLGFCLGLVGAICIGLCLGISRQMESYLAPSLHFLRSLPVALYVPLTLVLLGSGIEIPIFLSALVTSLYGSVPVIQAVRDYDREKLIFVRARGYNLQSIAILFILPEIVTALSTSISIVITLSLAVTVIAEMLLPGLGGLGAFVIKAKEVSNYQLLWASTFFLGLCGFIFHSIVLRSWRFAAPWVD